MWQRERLAVTQCHSFDQCSSSKACQVVFFLRKSSHLKHKITRQWLYKSAIRLLQRIFLPSSFLRLWLWRFGIVRHLIIASRDGGEAALIYLQHYFGRHPAMCSSLDRLIGLLQLSGPQLTCIMNRRGYISSPMSPLCSETWWDEVEMPQQT